MTKYTFILFFSLIIQSCSTGESKNIEGDPIEPSDALRCVVSIHDSTFNSKAPFRIRYFTFIKTEKDSKSYFDYVNDSTTNRGESAHIFKLESDKTLLRCEYDKYSDTLILKDGLEPNGQYDQIFKYVLKDSFNLVMNKQVVKIFECVRIEANDKWDEIFYFSSQYGLLLARYDHFRIHQAIRQHCMIPQRNLLELKRLLMSRDSLRIISPKV